MTKMLSSIVEQEKSATKSKLQFFFSLSMSVFFFFFLLGGFLVLWMFMRDLGRPCLGRIMNL